jgi:hypothetical protein
MTPVMKSKRITYKVEFNSYIYDIVEYYDNNNNLIADIMSVDGMPIDTRSYAIRNMLSNFIKDYRNSI